MLELKRTQDGFRALGELCMKALYLLHCKPLNDTLQIFFSEGVIADYGMTLGDLIGVLYQFFKKLGIEKLRFKPAYNPYTEPSMEIFSYHPGLGKWVEIGNSGE